MVEADAVEAVLEREHALDLVRLDHCREDVAHEEWLPRIPGNPIRYRQDAAEVVRRMAPLGGEPGVVEVEPADHRADAEGRLYRIELKLRPGHLGAVRHHRAWHDGAEELGACGVLE